VIYLFLEFPFGTLSFSVAVSLLAAAFALLLYPFGALVAALTWHNGHDGFSLPFLIWQALPPVLAAPIIAVLCVVASVLGIILTVGSMHALNAMAYGWARFASVMLGMSSTEMELVEAQVIAARQKKRAETSDQRRRELIVNVSHELRTPIANIRGHVESLRLPTSTQLSEADKDRYLGIVAREADRLSTLVDDLLSLARADADELHLEVRPVAVESVVEEVQQALAPLAHRDRQVTLVRNTAPSLPPALVDRDRLAQVLLNLARNAITATPAGGLVFLDLEQADQDHLSLSVSDTGYGIAEEDLDRVFDRFYRADTSRQRTTGGFGLGLSIVRDLVQAMGGTISVHSTVGVGSCFTVLLRIATSSV
jgi:signal transduction histidine kinase